VHALHFDAARPDAQRVRLADMDQATAVAAEIGVV